MNTTFDYDANRQIHCIPTFFTQQEECHDSSC